MDKKLKEAFESISERIKNMSQEEIDDLNKEFKLASEKKSNFQILLPIDYDEEDTINSAIAELYALNIPNAEYEYEVVDGCWVNIKHNISDLISTDDDVAYKIGEVLKKSLIDKGITHFSFYQED